MIVEVQHLTCLIGSYNVSIWFLGSNDAAPAGLQYPDEQEEIYLYLHSGITLYIFNCKKYYNLGLYYQTLYRQFNIFNFNYW